MSTPNLLYRTACVPILLGALLLATPAMAQDERVRIQIPDIEIDLSGLRALDRLFEMDLDFDRFDLDLDRFDLDVLRSALRHVGRDMRRLPRLARSLNLELQDRNFQATETDTATHTVDIGANGSLDLRNVSGDIVVEAGSGNSATVVITRRSRGRTDEDARNGLERVQVEINESPGRAQFTVRYPENERRFSVDVAYRITAPVGTRLTLEAISGDVTVRGIHGDVDVEVVSGDIEVSDARRLPHIETVSGTVRLRDVQSDDLVSVSTISGTVDLQGIQARRLQVKAVSGGIDAGDITAGDAELTTMNGGINYQGPIGAGGRYEFQSHNGEIELTLGGAVGFELRASTFSGGIDLGNGIDESGLSRTRRSVQGRVGDGRAVVIATTFSGGVTIRRR